MTFSCSEPSRNLRRAARRLLLGSSLGVVLLAQTAPAAISDDDVALQAGRIYLVEGGVVIENGTVLVRDGRIVAVGADVDVPRGVPVVDYGPDAVLTPGLVAADSGYGSSIAAERTASPTLRAADHFDPYHNLLGAVRAGVTTVYLAPARGRLIAGQGAVVKSYGEEDGGNSRLLSASACLHGSIAAEARRTRGYWEVPIPATVDVGLGVEQPQLPRTTMGAMVALEELLSLGDQALAAEYGAETGPVLKKLMEGGTPWRMGAGSMAEVCALLEFFKAHDLPLILDCDYGASEKPEEVAKSGVPVIAGPQGRDGRDFGKGPDAAWPDVESVSRLVKAGVRVAIVARGGVDLRVAATLARKGGMSADEALLAVTLTPAQLLGVDDRVGSITVGKDGDFAVFSGPPMDTGSTLIATWVSGELAHKADPSGVTVIEVDELHVGDGRVLRPGQLLMSGGRLTEVGTRVAHPPGATVVRGAAAMPGMIDALGHLGLEGSTVRFDNRFDLTRILEPGDETDRHVARAGVTTVNLGSRSSSGTSPTIAYKPAGSDVDRMVVASPACLRMTWDNNVRSDVGASVRQTLGKAAEYKKKWEDYEKAIATWTPPAPEPDKDAEEGDKDADEDKAKEGESDENGKENGKDKKDKKDKKKKKKGEKAPARPVTGQWEGSVKGKNGDHALRLRILERDLALEGTLRGEGLDELITLEGVREEYHVTLSGLSSIGRISFDLQLEEDTLTGTGAINDSEAEVTLKQVSEEYPVAQRPERRKKPSAPSVKGKPKSPGIDPNLEPLRQAMLGNGAIVVTVTREDDILECVSTFEQYGIKPILWGASGASKVAGQLRNRVAGVVTRSGLAKLSRAGLPVAMYSGAEEGASALPQRAAALVAGGMSPMAALRALTSDAARMFSLSDRVGTLQEGLDADVVLLDGSPLDVSSSVQRVWVNGEEIR